MDPLVKIALFSPQGLKRCTAKSSSVFNFLKQLYVFEFYLLRACYVLKRFKIFKFIQIEFTTLKKMKKQHNVIQSFMFVCLYLYGCIVCYYETLLNFVRYCIILFSCTVSTFLFDIENRRIIDWVLRWMCWFCMRQHPHYPISLFFIKEI